MKHIFLIMLSSIMLSACGSIPERPVEIVTVDKAVPYCPAPPDIQKTEYMVDKLEPNDISNPGRVAKAYVYDMTLLRSQIKIYQMILDEYSKTTQDFDAVKREIDKLQSVTPK